MGTWGSGNFDNDNAMDYMNEVKDELIGRIEECLVDDDSCALDEDGEGVLMPTLEILSVLAEHCRLGLPELETIQRWKARYLAVYDDSIDGLEPKPGYKEARRAMIEATFLKLEAQAYDYQSQLEWFDESREPRQKEKAE
jgi:hypothetical protein